MAGISSCCFYWQGFETFVDQMYLLYSYRGLVLSNFLICKCKKIRKVTILFDKFELQYPFTMMSFVQKRRLSLFKLDSLVQGAICKENLVQQGQHCGTSCQIQCLHVEAILCWKSCLFNNINNCCNKRKCFCWNQSHWLLTLVFILFWFFIWHFNALLACFLWPGHCVKVWLSANWH